MAVRASDLLSTRDAVWDVVSHEDHGVDPTSLIKNLVPRGYMEDDVLAAIWYMIDEKKLSLTEDWLLRVVNGHQK